MNVERLLRFIYRNKLCMIVLYGQIIMLFLIYINLHIHHHDSSLRNTQTVWKDILYNNDKECLLIKFICFGKYQDRQESGLTYHQNRIVVYDDGRDNSERKNFFSDAGDGLLDYKGHSVFVKWVTMNKVRHNDKHKEETC